LMTPKDDKETTDLEDTKGQETNFKKAMNSTRCTPRDPQFGTAEHEQLR
jgi:hypothetical protein